MSSFEYLVRELQKRWRPKGLTPGVLSNFGHRKQRSVFELSIYLARSRLLVKFAHGGLSEY